MSYGAGYYDGGDYAAMYEEQEQYEEPQPQPRQRGGQSLRSYAQGVQAENAELKRKLREAEEAIQDLVGQGPQQGPGYVPQNGQQPGVYPHPRSEMLTPEQQMQLSRMVEMGAQAAPPMGSDREMANRIQNTRNAAELMDLLRTQGNTNGTMDYTGTGE